MSDEISDSAVDVELVSSTVLSDGFRRMVHHDLRHRKSDGEWSAVISRDIHEGNHVAAVIAYDPDLDSLVLLRQFRLAAHLVNGHGLMVETPAGGVEPGETGEAAAKRELHEETHLEATGLVHCFDFMPSPGITMEHASLFLARVDASQLPERAGEDADEDIAPFLIRFDDAMALLHSGLVTNGFLLMALLWLAHTGKTRVREILSGKD